MIIEKRPDGLIIFRPPKIYFSINLRLGDTLFIIGIEPLDWYLMFTNATDIKTGKPYIQLRIGCLTMEMQSTKE